MELVTRPLTKEHWPDLEALFAAKGCSMARGCWCMYYRESGKVALEAYPVDKVERSADAWLWRGAVSMYTKAGFVEVARRKPERPVERWMLGSERWGAGCWL